MQTFTGEDLANQNGPSARGSSDPDTHARAGKVPDPFNPVSPAYWAKSISALLFENKLNLLMLCFPLAMHAKESGLSEGTVFFMSLLAIAPFAERLSFVTEQLAMHTSDALGGLLNATFGSAPG